MTFDRNLLPEPELFFEAEGLPLRGKGTWRTTRCDFHGGSDSMRVNTQSGGWVCMSCGVSGGDAVAYLMQRYDASFVQAANTLGAWVDDGKATPKRYKPFSASDACIVMSKDLHLCAIVLSDARRGVLPIGADWQAFLHAAGRCIAVAEATR